MRTALILASVLLLVLLGSTLFICRDQPTVWSTSSEVALQAFEKGLDAEMKLYLVEAHQYYHRALEADPNFVAARTRLLDMGLTLGNVDEEQLHELRSADFDALEPRERFLAQHFLARLERDGPRASRLTQDFLAAHPDDPFALSYSGETAIGRGAEDEAELHFQRLQEIEPNWVKAQNWLGYIAMGRGQFEEAERHFRTYQYIAPDQANPHDSMGELLMLLGRYEDAEEELHTALSNNQTFGASWVNLVSSALLQQDLARAELLMARAGSVRDLLSAYMDDMRCNVAYARGAIDEDWESAYQSLKSCQEESANVILVVMTHRAALRSGRIDEALQIEEEVATFVNEHPNLRYLYRRSLSACSLDHMRGLRLAGGGDLEAANVAFDSADDCLTYRNIREGLLKLNNRMARVLTLEAMGRAQEAQALEDKVRQVNAPYADLSREFANRYHIAAPTRPPAS